MKLKFIGATETVTGSKHLVLTEGGTQVLLDCGLYQGMGRATDGMNRKLGLNPAALKAVILSHAHIDHSGNLPGLVSQGYEGPIYCTPATLDVCRLLLLDSAHIQESDVAYENKRRRKKGMRMIRPLYTVEDAERCLGFFKAIDFSTDFRINPEVSFYFSDNGHIVGSAAVNLTVTEASKVTRLAFTGDIGRYADPLLRAPAVFQQADYIISESTYGDRVHESAANVESIILDIVKSTCVERGGRLVIPAFSLGRTQEIIFVLDKLKNKGLLPEVRVFVDSPLSSKATDVVRDHVEAFNDELRQYIRKDPDPFGFPALSYVEDHRDSMAINEYHEPCVIISASGMAEAGRVQHHLRYSLQDARNTVLITGYCAPQTLGAKLLSGAKQVRIFGDLFNVKARIESIHSLSAHGDREEMVRFLSCQSPSMVKEIFLVHGEEGAKAAFATRLNEAGFSKVTIPKHNDVFTL